MKPWWESKTIWLNVVVGILATADALTGALKPILPPDIMGGIVTGLAIANVALRAMTGQPVSLSKPASPKSQP